jgi:hypothetical protein
MQTIDNLFKFKSRFQRFSHFGQGRGAKQAPADIRLIGNHKEADIAVPDFLKGRNKVVP